MVPDASGCSKPEVDANASVYVASASAASEIPSLFLGVLPLPTLMRVLALLLIVTVVALPACDSGRSSAVDPTPSFVATGDGDAVVVGRIAAVDLAPLAYDAPGVVTVDTDSGPTAVFVEAFANLCEAEGLGVLFELAPGDRVEVLGELVERRGGIGEEGVLPCASADHYVRRR